MSSQPTNTIPWLVYSDTTNEVIVSGELEHQGQLNKLAQYAQGRQATVLTNSADVRLHRHIMATKPSRQIIKALPYMLEDELAEDIDALHIATEDSGLDKDTGKYWLNIAVVNKALVTQWIETLSTAGLTVKRLVPESLCLPFDTDLEHEQLTALEVGNGWVFRQDRWQGTFVELPWLPIYVGQLISKTNHSTGSDASDVESDDKDKLVIKPYSPMPNEIASQLSEADNIILAEAEPELAMLIMAKEAENVKWNLLQGDLAPKKQVSKNWQIWRNVGVIALFVFILEFASSAVKWHNVSQELEQKKAELVTLYQSAFPKEKVRVALLKRQLTRKVTDATGGVVPSDNGFLKLMLTLTPVLQKHNSIVSESYRFDASRGELRISANAPSFQKFEQFRIALEQLGLEVTQGAVSNEGDIVSGTINVKEAT